MGRSVPEPQKSLVGLHLHLHFCRLQPPPPTVWLLPTIIYPCSTLLMQKKTKTYLPHPYLSRLITSYPFSSISCCLMFSSLLYFSGDIPLKGIASGL